MNNLLKFKNDLNKIAELSWEEFKTTNYIKKSISIKPIKIGFLNKNTGLIYKLGNGKNSILLRADIDGLKTNNKVKHICGHSTHTSSLMQTLIDTINLEDKLNKNNKSIYFLFQPSEENFPSGAKAFLDENKDILKEVKYAFSIHVKPLSKNNVIGLKEGPIWARGDYLEIEIKGKMVHIKDNMVGIDALEASSKIILFIKKLQEKYFKDIRINIGTLNGGHQPNTVADEAILKGDFRVYNEKLVPKIKQIITKEFKKIEIATKNNIKLNYYSGVPPVNNDKELTTKISKFLKINSNFIVENSESLMSFGCEDFSYISSIIPSLDAFIGTGDKYDIHEVNCTISDSGTISAYKYFTKIVEWWINF